jgi:hypothetical protein
MDYGWVGWWFLSWFFGAAISFTLGRFWKRLGTRQSKLLMSVAIGGYFSALALPPILGAIYISLQVGALLTLPMMLTGVLRVGEEYDGVQETLGQVIVHRIEGRFAVKKNEGGRNTYP